MKPLYRVNSRSAALGQALFALEVLQHVHVSITFLGAVKEEPIHTRISFCMRFSVEEPRRCQRQLHDPKACQRECHIRDVEDTGAMMRFCQNEPGQVKVQR